MEKNEISITNFIKPYKKIGVADLSAPPKVTLNIRRVGNGFHIVSVDKHTHVKGKKRELDILLRATLDQKDRFEKEFAANSGIVAVCTKRKSKWLNELVKLRCPLWKKTFEDKYFVLLLKSI